MVGDRVSVVVVNFMGSSFLKESIPVILEDRSVGEVIVVDNSCSAREKSRLLKLKNFYGFRLFINQNEGFGRACNLGIRASRFNWVFVMNPDVIPDKDSISKLLECAESEKAHIAAPKLYMSRWDFFTPPFDVNSILWEFLLSPVILNTRIPFLLYKRLFETLQRAEKPKKVGFLPGAALLMRKGVIYFDTDFFLYFEDTDLCIRARRMGLSMVFCPNSRMLHLFSGSIGRIDNPHFGRSRRMFLKKHRSPFLANILELLKRIKVKKVKADDKIQGKGYYRVSPSPFLVPYTVGYIGRDLPSFLKRGIGRFYFEKL